LTRDEERLEEVDLQKWGEMLEISGVFVFVSNSSSRLLTIFSSDECRIFRNIGIDKRLKKKDTRRSKGTTAQAAAH
jgi:hypothetical protein